MFQEIYGMTIESHEPNEDHSQNDHQSKVMQSKVKYGIFLTNLGDPDLVSHSSYYKETVLRA